MPETAESTRRWNGYVCPDCRFVFRVARDHDGSGVVCPGCRRLLRVPTPDDTLPPLVVPLPPSADPATRRKGRRRRSRRGDSGEWERENSGQSGHHQRRDSRQMRWILIGGALVLVLCVAAVIRAMKSDPVPTVVIPPPIPVVVEPPASTEMTDAVFLAKAEPLAKQFLTVKSLGELLPLVRGPERAAQRIRAFHGGDAIEPEGMNAFNTQGSVERDGPFLSVVVRNNDFVEKNMSFVNTPDGLKIDWESYVGWSAMPWDGFLANKPTSPTLFRVVVRPVDYYNFGFADDSRWRSYRLDSPDGEHSIYGYVERGSPVDSRIQLPPETKSAAFTLYLRFPDDAGSRDQVLIERVASENWLIENEDPP